MKRDSFLFFTLLIVIFISGKIFAGNRQDFNFPGVDTAIHNDETARHFNIGGHIFAGEYPINNPESTGDTGYVYLYRLVNNNVIPVDTTIVTTFGYYTFSNIIQGNYILKAGLKQTSSRYHAFFPTYYTNSLKWNTSEHLALVDSNKFEENIHLTATTDTLSGPASMSGFVMQTLKDPGFQKMSNTEIVLYNASMAPLVFSFSDKYGNFSFTNLPFGTYYLMVESTGKYPNLLRVTLDVNHPSFDSLMLEVLSHAPMNIQEVSNHQLIESSPVFPNPSTDNMNLVLRSGEPETMTMEIFTMSGMKVHGAKIELNGYKSISIPVGQLSKGVYFIRLLSENGKWSQTQKIMKE